MQPERFLQNRKLKDFNPVIVGSEKCKPNHAYGPAVRWHTLIHFVLSGEGVFCKGDQEYHVHAGEAFIILPEEITYYRADGCTPWHYVWIGFDGELSARFAELPPVIAVPPETTARLFADGIFSDMDEYEIAARLLCFYSELFAEKKETNHYVRQVRDYIKASYMEHLQVERIAESMHLNRRYLSRLFKEKTGYTMQEYIIKVRMDAAARFLEKGYSVSETASFCGYEDVSNFTKIFKQRMKLSPSAWRNGKR
jgi:AraC-like DNA-binding protein